MDSEGKPFDGMDGFSISADVLSGAATGYNRICPAKPKVK